ncbi:fumarylacetoacetate hydrolase family protein [Novosphingobium resinovorum]|uniref:Fumarylacetoacetase n=1 Tax=Novosphingobium resinovorum TaxID=158500 RepID=A0A1D8A6N6_9SPHN|nr:fumarylacetoacetate hydrolase family protein [Novosphingobium resinovorum]AOR77779.1 fumarylacetoacetase [Novosphingobium resinovorum]
MSFERKEEQTTAHRLFASPTYPTVPVTGEPGRYPVHRIFCVGRNYADHAKEMGAEVDRQAPFYFMKDAQTLVASGSTVPYPPGTSNFHYEMELVLAVGQPIFRASRSDAEAAVFGYACGLDMTRRDLQLDARAKQRPWDIGKNVERSAIIGPITRREGIGEMGPRRISLSVDGTIKQDAHLSDLIWSPGELLEHLSQFYHLAPGDLIYTGTPAGVGPVVAGQHIRGEVDGLEPVELTVTPAE